MLVTLNKLTVVLDGIMEKMLLYTGNFYGKVDPREGQLQVK